jgi:hypothetical protein
MNLRTASLRSEKLSGKDRNTCPIWIGIAVRIRWNAQRSLPGRQNPARWQSSLDRLVVLIKVVILIMTSEKSKDE